MPSNLNKVIHSDTFTDANGELHYLNTGRDNVSGLYFPNHYVRNKDNYKYTRLLNIKISPDTSLVYPIHECFLLTTYKNDNSYGLTNIININAIVREGEGTVKAKDIEITCTPLNYISNISDNKIHTIYGAIKSELVDGNTEVNLGIWLDSTDIIDILVKDLTSLSYTEIPNNIYHQFLQCDYESYYLNNEDIMYEVNMFNLLDSIGSRIITGVNTNATLIDKIKNVSQDVTQAIPDYQFLSVVYNDLYSIKETHTDEIINPYSFQYVEVGNSFATIKNNCVCVNEPGHYLIALKVNMDIHEGMPTKMTLSLFLNNDRVEETTCTLYLDPNNKIHPLGFLSGQVQIMLNPTDKLYLKARWTDKTNVNIENHCTLQITKLNKIVK